MANNMELQYIRKIYCTRYVLVSGILIFPAIYNIETGAITVGDGATKMEVSPWSIDWWFSPESASTAARLCRNNAIRDLTSIIEQTSTRLAQAHLLDREVIHEEYQLLLDEKARLESLTFPFLDFTQTGGFTEELPASNA